MKHEEKMERAWKFIADVGITDDPEKFKENDRLIFVENLYSVRDAFYEFLEKKEELLAQGWDKDNAEFEAFGAEDIYGFLDQHKIGWK